MNIASENRALDCLLVHVPKFQTYYPPLNVYQSCNRMAMGLLALGDVADRAGYGVKVLHAGIETVLDRDFDLGHWVQRHRPSAVGFSLHFHHSLIDTLRLVREVKARYPQTFVFLGGFTATFFARQIMECLPEADAVILGDAEVPLLRLLEAVISPAARSLDAVPNLIWRRNGRPAENQQTFVADEDTLEALNYARFDLLEHAKTYVGMPTTYISTRLPVRLEQRFNRLLGAWRGGIYWGLPVGRGCVANCFYCGGGAPAQWRLNHRRGVIFRQPDKVVDTIRDLKNFGFTGSYVSFDPHPWSQPYYVDLFRQMARRRIRFDIQFSSWGLPTAEFLEAFARFLTPGSVFMISPETGCERLRRKLRRPAYTNSELMAALVRADRLGIRTRVFFCVGVPGERRADFQETLNLQQRIRDNLSHSAVEAFLVEIEPGAPWHLDPEKFGIHLLRCDLNDFLCDQARADYSSMTCLGYTSDFFGRPELTPEDFSRRLQRLRERHFDQPARNALMGAFWGLARRLRLVNRPRALTAADCRPGDRCDG